MHLVIIDLRNSDSDNRDYNGTIAYQSSNLQDTKLAFYFFHFHNLSDSFFVQVSHFPAHLSIAHTVFHGVYSEVQSLPREGD